jgi:hypothetical protein
MKSTGADFTEFIFSWHASKLAVRTSAFDNSRTLLTRNPAYTNFHINSPFTAENAEFAEYSRHKNIRVIRIIRAIRGKGFIIPLQ